MPMWKSWETIGIMAVVHAVAMFFNYLRLEFNERNDRVWPCVIVTVISFILFLASLPVSLVSFALQYFYRSRNEYIHRMELIDEANKNYALGSQKADALQQEIDTLQDELLDARIERYDAGHKTGYRSGYIDGYVASCENALSEEDSHLALDWRWKRDAQSAAQNSLKRKEHMDQVREDI